MITLELLQEYLAGLLGLGLFRGFLGGDLRAFLPELALCLTVITMLVWPIVFGSSRSMGAIASAGTLLALGLAWIQWKEPEAGEVFGGMLVSDHFTVFCRLFLLAVALLVIWLTALSGFPEPEDSADFYTLLLGSVVGMSMMAAANNLFVVFLAVEMASVPSYAMAGFLKHRRQSSEAALKYVVFGGAAAGVMLYGLTLLAGMFGTLHLPTLVEAVGEHLAASEGLDLSLWLALVLVLVGLAFKLSAFPFHFWCPDVFEGAAAEVAAFLSVASKGAAVALLARFTLALVGAGPAVANYLGPVVAVMSAVTCTFGNLAAYGQTNLKRLLAYSTIAHAGYMMMALATLTPEGARAVGFYLLVYAPMNLGAFAVVAFIRNQTGSEDLDACRGLIHRAPVLAVAMCVFMLSLTGIPPMAGFIGKFQIFAVLYDAGHQASQAGEAPVGWVLLGIGGLNTVFSLFYYVSVLRAMILEGEPAPGRDRWGSTLYTGAMAVAVLVLGIFFQPLLSGSQRAIDPFARAAVQAPRLPGSAVAATPARAPASLDAAVPGGRAP